MKKNSTKSLKWLTGAIIVLGLLALSVITCQTFGFFYGYPVRQEAVWIEGNSFFYFDPPYRPLNATSSFNDYTKEAFNDLAQKRLKDFCDQVQAAGHHFMLSNSDCQDGFFDDLYMQYQIERVWASRSINANPKKRGKLTELLIRNYI